MSVIWHKVWYDLWHNKLRTILVVLSIAMGVFAVGTTFGLVEQMVPQMDQAHHSTNPSHGTMFLLQPVDLETIESLQDTPGVEGLDPLNSIEIRYKLKPESDWKKGSILMRDYDQQVYDVLQLKAGAWPDGENLSIEACTGPFTASTLATR